MATQDEIRLLIHEELQAVQRLATRDEPKKQARGFWYLADLLGWTILIGVFVILAGMYGPDLLMAYGVVSPETMAKYLPIEIDAPAQPPAAQPPAKINTLPSGGGYTSTGGSSAPAAPNLPDCATVADSTTACQWSQPPTVDAQPTPAPAPTAPYLAPCETAPGARPCWLPADQEWTPIESVPETPIVLLPEPAAWEGVPFIEDKCATWHAPMPWPEECNSDE